MSYSYNNECDVPTINNIDYNSSKSNYALHGVEFAYFYMMIMQKFLLLKFEGMGG